MFVWVDILKLREITYDKLKFFLMGVCPAELRVLSQQTPYFVGVHSIVWAVFAQVCYKPQKLPNVFESLKTVLP